MFLSANDKVQNQKLKIQQLLVRAADTHLYTVSGSDILVNIGEAVSAVVCAVKLKDSDGSCTKIAAASCSIQDHSSGDQADIKLASVSMASNYVLMVCFISK